MRSQINSPSFSTVFSPSSYNSARDLRLHSTMADQSSPLRIGVALYPGFQALDVFGPLDCLNTLSKSESFTLALLSSSLEPVSTSSPQFPNAIGQSVVPTHTYAAPPELDVLLVPGGIGAREPGPMVEEVVTFIRDVYPSLKYLITVCTGSGLAACAGVLDGRRATTNKRAWHDTTALSDKVKWQPYARWVVDGNIWTSSGISAGIDVTLAWIEAVFSAETAKDVADRIEYSRWENPDLDPFAELYGL